MNGRLDISSLFDLMKRFSLITLVFYLTQFSISCNLEVNTSDPQSSRDIKSSIRDSFFIAEYGHPGDTNRLFKIDEAWVEYAWKNKIVDGEVVKKKLGGIQLNLKLSGFTNPEFTADTYIVKWNMEDDKKNWFGSGNGIYDLEIKDSVPPDSIRISIGKLEGDTSVMKVSDFLLVRRKVGNSDGIRDTITREIPLDRKGRPDLSYLLDKQKANQLALDPIENGYDSLQIRVWFDYSLAIEKHLVVIKRTGGMWDCQLYTMKSDWNDNNDSEVILSKSVLRIQPRMGWDMFVKRLFDLNITTLPNGPAGGLDGASYDIEVATKRQYRYYSYWSPETSMQNFQGSRDMVRIIHLLEDVCDFKRSQD